MNFQFRHEMRWTASRIAAVLLDLAAVSAGYGLAYFVRFYSGPVLHLVPVTKGIPPFSICEQAWPVIGAAWLIALNNVKAYKRLHFPVLDEGIRLFKASVLGALLAMSAMFLYRENSYSRLVFLIGGLFSFGFLYLFRETQKFLYLSWIRSRRRPRRVLILGNGYLSRSLQKILQREGDRAVLRLNSFNPTVVRRTIERSRIREVLIANPQINHKDAVALAGYCEEKGIRFRLIPDILEIRMGEVIIDESLGIPTFQLKPLSLHGTSFLAKRAFDIVLSSLFMGVFFLPMALIAFLIKATSAGPVFYSQERLGFRSKHFPFMKFRTMVSNADDLLEELKAKSDRGGGVFKMKKDPRVTAVGRFLRRYSLDELPQLLNVLKGEMSLVGPRPQVIWETVGYNEWARKRLNVLPGITGLWQVSGRAELTFEEMIDLDVFYIEHWSPGLDLKILLKTLPAVVSGKGAY